MDIYRCEWTTNLLDIEYHDSEWGVPNNDDRKHFEFLILEMMQAGLSWSTILRKRESMREAFSNFSVEIISKYDSKDVERLLNNPGIIRNRLKVQAVINNAQRFLEIQREYGSFDKYIWNFVYGKPITNKWETLGQVPVSTHISDNISKDLKKRGFKFVGTTICYAYMQAVGLVNDHLVKCKRYKEINENKN